LFAIFSISTASWALFLGLFLNTSNLELALKFANSYYVSAAAIPIIFYFFSRVFKRENISFNKLELSFLAPFILIVLAIMTNNNFIVDKIFLVPGTEKDVVLNMFNYYLYTAYFIFFVVLSYTSLVHTHHATQNPVIKLQLKYVIGGTFLGYVLGTIFNLFLPAFGNYNLIWIGPLSVLVMVASVGYTIIKYHLFNLKVIATELFVFLLWFFILIRTILSESFQDQITNLLLLLAVTIIGFVLIKSVLKEVTIRKKLEVLTDNLERANEKLKELDELKTEFLSLASHQFRSPLTAMKGFSSLILEGSYGKINPAVKDAVEKIFQSSSNLAEVVQDFLDVSRIEQGSMKYEFEKVDLKVLVKEAVEILEPNVTEAGLKISSEAPDSNYFANVDRGKLNQVVINLIDNAQKYTKKGEIKVNLEKNAGKILIKIIDSGIGISKEDISKLFGKFVRNKGANEVNVKGTGLGLFIAKKIVEAHHGKIWVESEGQGKGSTFIVELDEEA